MNLSRTSLWKFAALSLMSCSQLSGAAKMDEWTKENTSGGAGVLCSIEANGEYFFVARSGNDVRLGSRIEMTGYPRMQFSIGWRFENEKGRSLSTKKQPASIKSKYVQDQSKVYAENVDQQTLQLEDSRSMEVSVSVKKCHSSTCVRETAGEGDVSYAVKVCSVPLGS
jgi:hypothetical protein